MTLRERITFLREGVTAGNVAKAYPDKGPMVCRLYPVLPLGRNRALMLVVRKRVKAGDPS